MPRTDIRRQLAYFIPNSFMQPYLFTTQPLRVAPKSNMHIRYCLASPSSAFGSAWFLAEHRRHDCKGEAEQKDARRHDGRMSEEKNGEGRKLGGLCEHDLREGNVTTGLT